MTKFRFCGNLSLAVVFLLMAASGCLAQQQGYANNGEKRRSADYYFRVGEVQLEKENWDAALANFNACLRQDHGYYDAYLSRAVVFNHIDSLNKAVTDYNIFLEFRPNHHEALFGRAQVRIRLNQYGLAKTDLLKLLTIPGGATTSIFFRQDVNTGFADKIFTTNNAKGYVYHSLGLVDTKLNEFDEAIIYFDSALASFPDDPDILVNRGEAYERKGDTATAISNYRQALKVEHQHVEARRHLDLISDEPFLASDYAERAFMFFEKGNYPAALEDYDKAISLEPNEQAYFLNRGLIKEMLNDNDGAYNDYTAALKINKRFEKALVNRGNLLTRIGRLDEAIIDYTFAIDQRPDYSSAYYNRAIARKRLQQNELACDDLRIAEKLGLPVEQKVKKNICGIN